MFIKMIGRWYKWKHENNGIEQNEEKREKKKPLIGGTTLLVEEGSEKRSVHVVNYLSCFRKYETLVLALRFIVSETFENLWYAKSMGRVWVDSTCLQSPYWFSLIYKNQFKKKN